jgi:hypothetical protein
MDPDQPAHPRSLVKIHAVRLPTLLQVEKLNAAHMINEVKQSEAYIYVDVSSDVHYFTYISKS